MRKTTIVFIVLLSVGCASFPARYSAAEAIRRVENLSTSELDPSVPPEPLGQWLRRLYGQQVTWEVLVGCGSPTNAVPDAVCLSGIVPFRGDNTAGMAFRVGTTSRLLRRPVLLILFTEHKTIGTPYEKLSTFGDRVAALREWAEAAPN